MWCRHHRPPRLRTTSLHACNEFIPNIECRQRLVVDDCLKLELVHFSANDVIHTHDIDIQWWRIRRWRSPKSSETSTGTNSCTDTCTNTST